MDKVIYETKIKVWGGGGRETVTVVTEPESGYKTMHTLTMEEWDIIEMILDALINPPNPVPYILNELSNLNAGEY